MAKTRSQHFAEQAYQHVISAQNGQQDFTKEYGRLCHRFPVLVMENGLAQTLGFLDGKARSNERGVEGVFLGHIAEVLGQGRDSLLGTVLQSELDQYLNLTRQTLSAAVWYKRFAQGVLGVDAGGEIDDSEDDDEQDAAP